MDKPESLAIDGEGVCVALIAARYNFNLVNALLETVIETLLASGVARENIETFRVPGSNEIPHAASLAAKTGEFDVIIGLGLIIEGDTNHDEIIGHATAHALQQAAMQFEVPIINGIITVRNIEQAKERISGKHDRGTEFAHAALEMAKLGKELMRRIIESDLAAGLDDADWMEDDFDDDDEDWRR